MSIKKLALSSASALIVGAMLAVPATAHHSFAPYDAEHVVTIEGNLKEVSFANPHVGVVVVAMKDGKEITYSIHGRSPAEWRRDGWKPSDFRVGEKFNVVGFPRRDNGLEVAIKTFTRVSDGKFFGAPPVQKY